MAPVNLAAVAQVTTAQLVAQSQPATVQLVQKVPALDSNSLTFPTVDAA